MRGAPGPLRTWATPAAMRPHQAASRRTERLAVEYIIPSAPVLSRVLAVWLVQDFHAHLLRTLAYRFCFRGAPLVAALALFCQCHCTSLACMLPSGTALTLRGPAVCGTPRAEALLSTPGTTQLTFPFSFSLLLLHTSGDTFCLGPIVPRAGMGCGLGLPEKNTDCPVKLELQTDNKSFF